MEKDSSVSGSEHPPWERLMRAFLRVLETEEAQGRAGAVCELFFSEFWFQQLVERRARRSIELHAVPSDWREDLEQQISLLFLQKVEHSPDLRVDRQIVEAHFGGWIWTIVDHLGAKAVQQLHRLYRVEGNSLDDVASATKANLDVKIDLGFALAELPPLTRTILSLYDEGHTLAEIADLVGEKPWRVYETFANAVARLKGRLGN